MPAELLENEVEGLADRFSLIDPDLLAANKRITNLALELMGAQTLQRLAGENDARAHRSQAVRNDMERLLIEIEADDDVRIVVITGTGRGFSAGADLKPEPDAEPRRTRRASAPRLCGLLDQDFPGAMVRFSSPRRVCMADQWMIKGSEYSNCNCAWGCPCQFNSPSTYGKCEAVASAMIDEGHFGDTRLDGLQFVMLLAWPREIADGNGRMQVIIDERAESLSRSTSKRARGASVFPASSSRPAHRSSIRTVAKNSTRESGSRAASNTPWPTWEMETRKSPRASVWN